MPGRCATVRLHGHNDLCCSRERRARPIFSYDPRVEAIPVKCERSFLPARCQYWAPVCGPSLERARQRLPAVSHVSFLMSIVRPDLHFWGSQESLRAVAAAFPRFVATTSATEVLQTSAAAPQVRLIENHMAPNTDLRRVAPVCQDDVLVHMISPIFSVYPNGADHRLGRSHPSRCR